MDHYNLNYYKINNTNYIVSLLSGFGNWHHQFNPTGMKPKEIDKEFDKWTDAFKKAYDMRKQGSVSISFVKNPMTPGL
jgi:hypothetical protein